MSQPKQEPNYQRFQRSGWVQPSAYPLDQPVNLALYRPVADRIGRLILPAHEARDPEGGCFFEVHHAPAAYAAWVGKTVLLRFSERRKVQARTWAVTRNVIFDDNAEKLAAGGNVLAERINRWRMVTPLESLAAGHPVDDIVVRLQEPVAVEEAPDTSLILRIDHEPVQISGRYIGLVTFLEPAHAGGDQWRVRHFNPASHAFDGAEEIIAVPPPVANVNGTFPSTSAQMPTQPLNATGWYIYGAPGADGMFIVHAWMPRALVSLQPQRVLTEEDAGWKHIRHEVWDNIGERKGTVSSVLCDAHAPDSAAALAKWREGDRGLLLHVYAGIGGKEREPAARAYLYFGHFAFGLVKVIREPLADELRFDITYCQIYTHNPDGLVAGFLDWSRYMGDRQFGWSGLRPVSDIIIKLDELDDAYMVEGHPYSMLDAVKGNLEQMAARYRIGDGRGATYVAAANNCAQDSAQAFYAAIVEISELIQTNQNLEQWKAANPAQAERLRHMQVVGRSLRRKLVGGSARRSDWRYEVQNLGISENALRNVMRGLGTWRTLLPRKTSDTFAQVFLEHDAAVWALATYQVGGDNPNIEPVPAFTF